MTKINETVRNETIRNEPGVRFITSLEIINIVKIRNVCQHAKPMPLPQLKFGKQGNTFYIPHQVPLLTQQLAAQFAPSARSSACQNVGAHGKPRSNITTVKSLPLGHSSRSLGSSWDSLVTLGTLGTRSHTLDTSQKLLYKVFRDQKNCRNRVERVDRKGTLAGRTSDLLVATGCTTAANSQGPSGTEFEVNSRFDERRWSGHRWSTVSMCQLSTLPFSETQAYLPQVHF